MQRVKANPIAFCLLDLFKHTLFDLKHSSMILLIENGVLANVGTLSLNQILLPESIFALWPAALRMPLAKSAAFAD